MKPLRIAGHKEGKRGQGALRFPDRKGLTARKRIEDFAKRIPDGVAVVMEIRRDETELIKSHRGYYFAVVVFHVGEALREVCGYNEIDIRLKHWKDFVHDWLKDNFLDNALEVKNMDGETITMPPSTTRLDDEGWKDYLTKIIVFAADAWFYEIPVKMPKYTFPLDEDIHAQIQLDKENRKLNR